MMQTDWSCSGTMWSRSMRHSFLLLLCSYYALTFIGPREARTGEPREKERTAALAMNAETSVLVIAALLDCADDCKVVKPLLISPARSAFNAVPAFVCDKRAKAAPVSITFIPKDREGFLLARARRRTMPQLGELPIYLYGLTTFKTFTLRTWVLMTWQIYDLPFMFTVFTS